MICSTRAISTAGVLRMIGKVENAITKQVTQRMTEAEPWFEERTNQVNALQVNSLLSTCQYKGRMYKYLFLGSIKTTGWISW